MARYSPSSNLRERDRPCQQHEDSPLYSYPNSLFQYNRSHLRGDLEARASTGFERRRWSFGRDGRSELHGAESLGWEEEFQGDC